MNALDGGNDKGEGHPSPEDVTRLRATHRTQYEFAVEAGALPADRPVTRAEVREAVLHLTAYERRALQSRIRRRLDKLDDLMVGEAKSYASPRGRPSDMPADVSLAHNV